MSSRKSAVRLVRSVDRMKRRERRRVKEREREKKELGHEPVAIRRIKGSLFTVNRVRNNPPAKVERTPTAALGQPGETRT